MGALNFDPNQVEISKYIADSELFVFIHQEDIPNVQRIPNLLAMKQLAELKFLTYSDVMDVKEYVVSEVQNAIFPKGGVLMADDTVLMDADPGIYSY